MSLKMLHGNTTPLKCKYHSAHECQTMNWWKWGKPYAKKKKKNALSRYMRKADQEDLIVYSIVIEGRSPSRHKQNLYLLLFYIWVFSTMACLIQKSVKKEVNDWAPRSEPIPCQQPIWMETSGGGPLEKSSIMCYLILKQYFGESLLVWI